MIDEDFDVMKTFTDYSDEVPVQFIQFLIRKNHPWANCMLKDVALPPDTILALIQRGNTKIVPNGDTILFPRDILVLCAKSVNQIGGVHLSEKQLKKNDSMIGKHLSEIPNVANDLIIMVQRGGQVIIPNGDTVLMLGDTLVINHTEMLE